MNIHTLDKVFALLLFLLGIYITTTSVEYGYMQGTTPGPGFFPFWVGLLIAGLSLINVVRSIARREALDNEIDVPGVIKSVIISLLLLAFVMFSEEIGMLLGCFILVLLIAWVIQPRWNRMFTLKIVATAVLFPLLAYLVFGVYLNVPVPLGTWFS